ncbi:alkaline phosphatase D family protein, partial [Actinophytocola sp.]|uniref:alkaline phosphatase D family protein n=1 Tax=Actinophytocola sp. TaxID=1872138 RepID=UPI002D7FFA25
MPIEVNRRQLLSGTAAAVGVAMIGLPAAATPPVTDTADPFLLGIASGDPLPDAVVLWTRLLRDPLGANPVSRRPVPVGWQVAEDERFRRVVRTGFAVARPELAHSVHVDVGGLRPARDYFYRFRAGRAFSPVGRTRTAPGRHADPNRLRVGVVSC